MGGDDLILTRGLSSPGVYAWVRNRRRTKAPLMGLLKLTLFIPRRKRLVYGKVILNWGTAKWASSTCPTNRLAGGGSINCVCREKFLASVDRPE